MKPDDRINVFIDGASGIALKTGNCIAASDRTEVIAGIDLGLSHARG